ncbi:DUF5991 domain-containing protein [uncultured Psychrobacter sp.]|uniref:DUF5991 domain-containing protein n=1 Tax=uncultured Psychrobacter sp. TaxID=259303 RepID=UPI00261A5C34|nr:DUF5991 domain-containing protein [uncultured Psychrobacter sp.]
MKIIILLTFMIGIISCSNPSMIDSISNTPKNYASQFYGMYEYDDYQTDEELGTGVGVFYNLEISKEICQISMEGYQTDKQLRCYIKPVDNNSIEIYDIEKDKKFGTIRKTDENKFFIDMSYYLEGDNYSYYIEKIE